MSDTNKPSLQDAAYDAMLVRMTILGHDLIDYAKALQLAREAGMTIDGADLRAMRAKMTRLDAAVSAVTANPWR